MVKITLDINKSVSENAQIYFEKAKKSRRKLIGLNETKQRMEAKLKEEEAHKEKVVQEHQKEPKQKRKLHWFEKFRWCYLSNGMLAVGGRDATTNEIVIKKHTEPHDFVFHTDMAGAPFVVLQTHGKDVDDEIKLEAATLCACFSKAWQRDFGAIEVFCAKPDQVTKHAQAGEYLGKGAFMIRGHLEYFKPDLTLAVGKYEEMAMAGPRKAVQKHCKTAIKLVPGDTKSSDIAKQIRKLLDIAEVDDVLRSLPTGGCRIEK